MADPLIFFIPGLFPPGSATQMPAITSAIADLKKSFAVEVESLGTGGQQQLVEKFVSVLKPGCHVVTTTWHANFGLLALNGRADIASYTAAGFLPSPATMRTAGMNVAADALAGHAALPGSYKALRLYREGAEEQQIRAAALAMDAERNSDRQQQSTALVNAIDLLERPLTLEMPVRYLRSRLDFGGTRELFLRLVPQASTARLELWPTCMQDAASGKELATKVSEFILGLPGRS